MFRLTSAVALGALLLITAPVALQDPPYLNPVGSSADALDGLRAVMRQAGVGDVPAAAQVRTHAVNCRRASSWLWGETGDAAQIEITASAAIEAGSDVAVRQRVAATASASASTSASDNAESSWRYFGSGALVTVDISAGRLFLRFDTFCLQPEDRRRSPTIWRRPRRHGHRGW